MKLRRWGGGFSFCVQYVYRDIHVSYCTCVYNGTVATWIEQGPNLSLLTLHPTSTAILAPWVIYSCAGADETTSCFGLIKQAETSPTHAYNIHPAGAYAQISHLENSLLATHTASLIRTYIVYTHIDSSARRCEQKLMGKNWKVSHQAQLWLVCNLVF